ncbi:MAG: hypothetical protein R3F48_03925 [Candidatus Zixiibacteriota bacterium]
MNESGRQFIVSTTDTIILSEGIIAAKPLADYFPNATIAWYKIESDARGKWYSNTSPEWHWDSLDYVQTTWVANAASVVADVAPTVLYPIILDKIAVGTMRYRVVIDVDGKKYSSPGMREKYKGCITEAVHRISRKGNTGNAIIDYGLTMCNNPYIWGSASFSGSEFDNQAERFLGADCADFAVAAARMAGYSKMPYGGSSTLGPYTDAIANARKIRRDVYIDGHGKKIAIDSGRVHIGDFIVWDGHVGLLYEDTDPIGVLNVSDLVLHTLFAEPQIAPIGKIYRRLFSICRPRSTLRE